MRDDRCAEEKRMRVVPIKEQKYLDAIQQKKANQVQVCDQIRKDWSGVDRVGNNKDN